MFEKDGGGGVEGKNHSVRYIFYNALTAVSVTLTQRERGAELVCIYLVYFFPQPTNAIKFQIALVFDQLIKFEWINFAVFSSRFYLRSC